MVKQNTINIKIFRWAGKWGPFEVKVPCGECTLTGDIIKDCCEKELKDITVSIETHDWLSNWWKPLLKGGFKAPIVIVDGKTVSQGKALNRSLLVEAVVCAHIEKSNINGTHVFGKENCKFCVQAKDMMKDNNLKFDYHDVIANPPKMYEMISRTKEKIGYKTPVTTPQIWIDGDYIGGAEQLEQYCTSHKKLP